MGVWGGGQRESFFPAQGGGVGRGGEGVRKTGGKGNGWSESPSVAVMGEEAGGEHRAGAGSRHDAWTGSRRKAYDCADNFLSPLHTGGKNECQARSRRKKKVMGILPFPKRGNLKRQPRQEVATRVAKEANSLHNAEQRVFRE